MRAIKVGVLAALLWGSMAGSAVATCGDAVADAICMTHDLLLGPSGLVPFATHSVETIRAIVFEILLVVMPPGGWL